MNENKHNYSDLKQMQSLPLEIKILMTQRRVKEWYQYWNGNVYVSRSGGKDSDVLGNIVLKMYPDVPQVFINTGLEYDSVRKHGIEVSDTVIYPDMNFVEVITEYGYPIISKEVSEGINQVRKGLKNNKEYYSYRLAKLLGTALDKMGNKSMYNQEKWAFLLDAPFKISNQCCDVMKKKPAKHYAKITNRKPFIGTMANESRLRKQQWIKNGCNGFEMKTPVSNPLSFWTEQDILQYIIKNDLKIAEAYGNIIEYTEENIKGQMKLSDYGLCEDTRKYTTSKAKRTGCTFCMFGITQDKDRFLKLK